jgi:hypothetical protein
MYGPGLYDQYLRKRTTPEQTHAEDNQGRESYGNHIQRIVGCLHG